MFQENAEAIAAAEKRQNIPAGDYEAVVKKVIDKPGTNGKSGSFTVVFAVDGGEYDTFEYVFFLTKSPAASGIRAKFYQAIGYVMPADMNIDENEWLGSSAKITIEQDAARGPKVSRVSQSEKKPAGDGDTPF